MSRPKSSSPASGGMWLNPPRERNTVTGLSTRCRCLVCGISGRKISSASVCAHHSICARIAHPDPECGQIRHHQDEDQERDHAGLIRDFSPSHFGRTTKRRMARPAIETATATAKCARKVKISAVEPAIARENGNPNPSRDMVERHQRECAKAPEDERMRDAGQGPLADHLGLEHHFPDEVPDRVCRSDGVGNQGPAWPRGSCAPPCRNAARIRTPKPPGAPGTRVFPVAKEGHITANVARSPVLDDKHNWRLFALSHFRGGGVHRLASL